MSDCNTDILVLRQHQAGRLCPVAAGGPVNEAPDVTRITEELQIVGDEQVLAARSLAERAGVCP